MSNLSQFLGVSYQKSQVFTATGTFTPSSTLLSSAGGWVQVFIVGGGGGTYFDGTSYSGGGGGAVIDNQIIQLSSTQTINITVGSGGASGGGDGGYSSVHWTSGVTGTVATTTGTTITASATNSIANGSYILIGSEIMYVSSGGGSTSLTVTRNVLRTQPATHSSQTIYIIGAAAGGGGGSYSSTYGNNYGTSGINTLNGMSFGTAPSTFTPPPIGYSAGSGAGGPATEAYYTSAGTLYADYFANPGIKGFGAGGIGYNQTGGLIYGYNAAGANSGAGGSGGGGGYSGIVILNWFE